MSFEALNCNANKTGKNGREWYTVLQGISLLEGTHWVGGIKYITGATASVEDLRPHLAQTKPNPRLLWDPLSPAEQWLGAGTPMDTLP